MTTNRITATALIGGSLAGLVTMSLHPSGHDVVSNASSGASNTLNSAVHLLSIVAQPLVLAGSLGITLRLRRRRDLALGAFTFFAIGSVAVIIAAVASGFIAPATLRGMASADDAGRAAMLGDLRFTGIVNQAFARVYVTFAGVALMLWSLAIVLGREMSRALGIYGLVLGVVLVVSVTTGSLALNIHGFGAIVLGIGAWFVWAATGILNEPRVAN